MSEPEQTVTLTIDGEEVTVPAGTLVIRAAEQLGTIIPRFCDHPLLDPVGACRQCIVEVEGQAKPMTSCTTPVQDGMVVRTHLTSDVAEKAQEGQLEFLLINHPLDCPMCDKGGECPLQDQSMRHGSNVSRFIDEKRRYNKPVAVSPLVLLDRERCVLCARCTRFSDQISGDAFIELFERGALEQVAIYEDEPYESYFAGNIIQICPVGALTSADYRFKARPFDTRSAPSVCDHCSAGCTLTVQSRRGEVQRQLARTNMPVNEMWTCDKGRFGSAHLTAPTRLRRPHVREGGELVEASWTDALRRATTALSEATEQGPDRVAVLTGSRLADEDAYAVGKYARAVLGTDHVDHRTRLAGHARTDEAIALAGRASATYADVEQAPVVITVGLDPEEEVPILFLRLRKAWRDHAAKLVPVGPRMGSLSEYAWRRLACDGGAELGALAALGRRLGLADLAPTAADASFSSDSLEDVVEAVRDSDGVVLLVGERAPAGALTAAAAIADQAGGSVAFVPRRAGAAGALREGLAAGVLPGGRRLDDDGDRAEVEDIWGGGLPEERGGDLAEILAAAADGDIDVLHLVGVDLARDCEDPELARRALQRATVIVQDLATNDTTPHADVLLPAAGTQERTGTLTNWEGRRQRFRAAIDPPELAQEDWEIVLQLAALLGEDLGFSDLDQLRDERDRLGDRSSPHDWPSLPAAGAGDRGGVAQDGAARDGDAGDAGEGGDTGRLRLLTYPLLLDRGTMLAGADNLLAAAPEPTVAVHPDDVGLGPDGQATLQGATVTVTAADEAVTLPLRLDPGLVPGTVFVPANSAETTGWSLLAAGGGAVDIEVHVPEDADAGDSPEGLDDADDVDDGAGAEVPS